MSFLPPCPAPARHAAAAHAPAPSLRLACTCMAAPSLVSPSCSHRQPACTLSIVRSPRQRGSRGSVLMFCGPEAVTYLSLPIYLSTNLLTRPLSLPPHGCCYYTTAATDSREVKRQKKELAGSLTTQDIGLRETDYGHAPEIFVDHKG